MNFPATFIRRGRLLLVPGLTLLLAARGLASPVTEAFNPNFNGIVHAALVQTDGSIVMGGAFTALHPNHQGGRQDRLGVAKFGPDGSLAEAFAPAFDGTVRALALDAQGRLLVGGGFEEAIDGNTSLERRGLARVLPDGTIDPNFAPQFDGEPKWRDAVHTVACLADGSIVVGGTFRRVRSSTGAAELERAFLVRLADDGSVIESFDPALNNDVLAVAAQPGGGFIAAGAFTRTGTTEIGRLARFNSAGQRDTAWTVAADNLVRTLAIEIDGSILVGGDFLHLRGVGESTLQQQLFVARVSAAGVRDTTFHPRPDARVTALAIEHSGTILMGGEFSSFLPHVSQSTQSASRLARLSRTGLVDSTFRPSPAGAVTTIALQEDGGIVLGGHFLNIYDVLTGVTSTRLFAARVHETGRVDAEFTTGDFATIAAVAERADGAIYVGGSFTNFAGENRSRLALISADGRVDPDFAPELNGSVAGLVLQADGKLVLGGSFTTVDGETQAYLARLNADGSLDTTFDPQPNGAVQSMRLESDGTLTVGGVFISFSPGYDADTSPDDYTPVTRPYLARVKADGTIDADWAPALNGGVFAMLRQADGRLVIGGGFTTVGTESIPYLARLNADGAPDETFAPIPNNAVRALALADNGDIVFGGDFSLLQLDDGEADDDDGDDATDDDATRVRLARVHADGSLDKTFAPLVDNTVGAIRILPDGDLLVGGSFATYRAAADDDDVVASSLVRLNSDGSLDDGPAWQTDGVVQMIAPRANGDLLIGGAFSGYYTGDGESARTATGLVRYMVEAGLDPVWAVVAAVDDERYVSALTIQRTGHVLAAGRFAGIAGIDRENVARFTADGAVLSSFNLRANGPVNTLLDRVETGIWDTRRSNVAWLTREGVDLPGASYEFLDDLSGRVMTAVRETDGSILIGGLFTNTADTSGSNLVRLRPDGTFDPDFRPSPSGTVADIQLQADGRIIVVGAFTTIAGQSQSYAARLLADGTFDSSFVVPKPSSTISVATLQPDGKVLIGGSFATFQVDDGEADDDDGDGETNDDTRQPFIARLNTNGTLDATFKPKPNAFVGSIAVHPSGAITFGGQFTTVVSADADSTTVSRTYLARVDSTGVVDDDFDPSPNAAVWDVDLLDDGRLLVAGGFTLFTKLTDHEDDDDDSDGDTDSDGKDIGDEDADVFFLARLKADGTLDTSFDPRPNATVREVLVEADGSLLVRGDFGAFFPNDADIGLGRNGVARVKPDGTLDTSFNPNPNDEVFAMLSLPDGSVLIGGDFDRLNIEAVLYLGGAFTTLNEVDLPRLARVQTDGNADGTYRPEPDGVVNALVGTPDGRILVAGEFTQLFGQPRRRLARLVGSGVLDTEFSPAIDGAVRTVALDQEGGIVIGGSFTQVEGQARAGLARLWSDGTLDATWSPGVNGQVDAVAVDLHGRVLVAGAFTAAAGGAQARLARIDADGTLDTAFAPDFNGTVHSLAVRADGRIAVGGAFSTVNGQASPALVVLNDDGSVAVAGSTETNGAVRALAIDREGRLVAGGSFTRFAGVSRALLSRTSGLAGAFGQALLVDEDGRGLTWVQTGGAAAPAAVRIAVTTDGENWDERGLATRREDADVWRWEGAPLPIEGEYLLRVRSITSATQFGSGSVREYYRHFIGTAPSGYGYGSTLPARFGSITGDLGDWLPGGAGIIVNPDGSGGDDDGGGHDDGGVDILGSRLRNLSTRVSLTGGDLITVGFVVDGAAPRRVLLRAVGPGLAPYLSGGEMEAPRLALHDADGTQLAANTGWQSSAQMRTWFTQAGAFALTPGSADAVLAPVLAPGAYTLAVNDEASAGGIVLAEVYDLGAVDVSDRLTNLSALSEAGEGDDALVVGFVIEGTVPKSMLIRAVGPGLLDYGVTDALGDVALTLHRAGGVEVTRNEDWDAPVDGGAPAAAIVAAAQRVGAFALDAGEGDAAVLIELAPGAYTVQLHPRGVTGTQGLIEIYEVAP